MRTWPLEGKEYTLLEAANKVLAHVEDESIRRADNSCTLCFSYRKMLREAIDREELETKRLQGVIEHDRSKVADILAECTAVLKAYWWLAEGRGSYEFDDDRWKDEFATCMNKLRVALDPMRVIAGDLSDSPIKWGDVQAARCMEESRDFWKQAAEDEHAKLLAKIDEVAEYERRLARSFV